MFRLENNSLSNSFHSVLNSFFAIEAIQARCERTLCENEYKRARRVCTGLSDVEKYCVINVTKSRPEECLISLPFFTRIELPSALDCPLPAFSLLGFLVHHPDIGHPSIHTGHYTAHFRDYNSQWFHANDSTIEPVSEIVALATSPYIALYRKGSDC